MGIFDRLKDGFDISDIPGILGDLQKDGGLDIGELLSGDFLKQFTQFDGLGDLVGKLGISNPAQITDLLQNKDAKEKADKVVEEHSEFSSLEGMLKKALAQKGK